MPQVFLFARLGLVRSLRGEAIGERAQGLVFALTGLHADASPMLWLLGTINSFPNGVAGVRGEDGDEMSMLELGDT